MYANAGSRGLASEYGSVTGKDILYHSGAIVIRCEAGGRSDEWPNMAMVFYVSSCVAHSTAMHGIQGNRPSGGGEGRAS